MNSRISTKPLLVVQSVQLQLSKEIFTCYCLVLLFLVSSEVTQYELFDLSIPASWQKKKAFPKREKPTLLEILQRNDNLLTSNNCKTKKLTQETLRTKRLMHGKSYMQIVQMLSIDLIKQKFN